MHTALMMLSNIIVEKLIRAGAEVSFQNGYGESAFLAADKKQQTFITKICKQENRKLIQDLPGHFATEKEKDQDIFEKVKQGKIDFVTETLHPVNQPDRAGFTMLSVAVQALQEDIVNLLIS